MLDEQFAQIVQLVFPNFGYNLRFVNGPSRRLTGLLAQQKIRFTRLDIWDCSYKIRFVVPGTSAEERRFGAMPTGKRFDV